MPVPIAPPTARQDIGDVHYGDAIIRPHHRMDTLLVTIMQCLFWRIDGLPQFTSICDYERREEFPYSVPLTRDGRPIPVNSVDRLQGIMAERGVVLVLATEIISAMFAITSCRLMSYQG